GAQVRRQLRLIPIPSAQRRVVEVSMARARQRSALANRDTPPKGVRTGQPTMPSPPGIIGRDAECARLAALVADPAPDIGMLLLEGEPGIGKSVLWQYGVVLAQRSGHRVLDARPGRAEQALTYAGLAALLPDPLLDETLPMLPLPRRQALEVALLRSSGPAANAVTVGLAVGSLLQALAARTRVVLAIDDLQWLDPVTTQVLEFALRRAPRGQV